MAQAFKNTIADIGSHAVANNQAASAIAHAAVIPLQKVSTDQSVETEDPVQQMPERPAVTKAFSMPPAQGSNDPAGSSIRPFQLKEAVVQRITQQEWVNANTTADFTAKHVAYHREDGITKAKTGRSGTVATSTVLIINNSEQKALYTALNMEASKRYNISDALMASAGTMTWKMGFGDVEIHSDANKKINHLHASDIKTVLDSGNVAAGRSIPIQS